ncbi:MAG: thermonuclease family protein [Myxococcota bacterium]|nr:thermonuclease family protein [Myxococcota bacterium]
MRRRLARSFRWLWAAALVSMALPAMGSDSFVGEVVGVADGDTVTVLMDNKIQHKIRLAEIDTPEKAQPYGQTAKQALSEYVYRQRVKVEVETTDRYGRIVGWLIRLKDNLNVNQQMVREGHAWVYTKYSRSRVLRAYEKDAEKNQRGLWALQPDQRIPPWDWRKMKRSGGGKRAAKDTSHCGPKKSCREMSSCDEAKRYLACGLKHLDGNSDGIPCNKLCRKK